MKPHSTDHISLVFGVLFLGVAGWWLIATLTDLRVNLHVVGWLVAGLLVTVGGVGVFRAVRSGRGSDD